MTAKCKLRLERLECREAPAGDVFTWLGDENTNGNDKENYAMPDGSEATRMPRDCFKTGLAPIQLLMIGEGSQSWHGKLSAC
jgi:hypothetical protein